MLTIGHVGKYGSSLYPFFKFLLKVHRARQFDNQDLWSLKEHITPKLSKLPNKQRKKESHFFL